MKKIAITLLVACVCLEAGCSRPAAVTPLTAASPTPPVTKEAALKRKRAIQDRKMAVDPAATAPMTEAVIEAPSPSIPKP